ncbi:hypothetical protein [Streptomyces sp. DH24]|uniref:hypothetical protein n=1 Tax=Streptomyces sp. DH24 TaxID=3040123 RepID=UPI00244114DF|nr:hypothetical protein [Streptomyces sp. DH24]MDG9716101.1 hypothetical protein [Streptomyces sp. DH24]
MRRVAARHPVTVARLVAPVKTVTGALLSRYRTAFDTRGLLLAVLAVLVTPASTTDRDAARIPLPTAKRHFRWPARV